MIAAVVDKSLSEFSEFLGIRHNDEINDLVMLLWSKSYRIIYRWIYHIQNHKIMIESFKGIWN